MTKHVENLEALLSQTIAKLTYMRDELDGIKTVYSNIENARIEEKEIWRIIGIVSKVFVVDYRTLKGPKRGRRAADARKCLVLALRELGLTYKKIGAVINRDHSSVMYMEKKCYELMSVDPEYKDNVSNVLRALNA